MLRFCVAAVFISFCVIATLQAQNYRAKISGIVTDPSGPLFRTRLSPCKM